jgi:hypothetical protein
MGRPLGQRVTLIAPIPFQATIRSDLTQGRKRRAKSSYRLNLVLRSTLFAVSTAGAPERELVTDRTLKT